MYATCTFCHRTLGSNESIEVFPVGRKLAFDGSRGRLWVVCPHCAQWNLTPLDERWEAIEDAERLFRESKLRHSTDNIGLARLHDGTELIRIGKPLRPEMASWRYGQNFARRHMGKAVGFGAATTVVAGGALLIPGAGFLAGAAVGFTAVAIVAAEMMRLGGKVTFVGTYLLDNEHQYVHVPSNQFRGVRAVAHESGWALRVPYISRRSTIARPWRDQFDLNAAGVVTISGQEAVTAARQLMPLINGFGARKAVVNAAVTLASSWSNSSSGFAYSLAHAREFAAKQYFGDPGSLSSLPSPVRLALEMSLHEDEEQRALDGELAELERIWREAEEIAGISDALMVPGRVQRTFDQLRGRNPPT